MRKLNIKEMTLLASEHGGKCLSQKYINNHTKLVWECRERHQWGAIPKNIKSDGWCPKCTDNKKKS